MLRSWYWSKWLTFSFAALLQLSSGLGYTFSIYSNDLKKHFKCACLQMRCRQRFLAYEWNQRARLDGMLRSTSHPWRCEAWS